MNTISNSNLQTESWLRILLNSSIITLLLIFNFALLPISGGESHYLSFAKQFANPEWIPGSFSLTEFPGTRLIFQYLVGSVLNILDFESTAMLFRILNFVLIAIPLALIFSKLRLRTFEWMIMFQLFIMSGQSLFAKEWIFGTFEPKTLSYAFVMFSIYYWLIDRKYLMLIFLAIAFYFHVLVGGWILLLFMILEIYKGNILKYIKPGFAFTLLVSPFFVYLISGYFGNNTFETDVNTNYAYVYYRLPHHLGLVKSWPFFFEYHFTGILLTLICFLIIFRFRPLQRGTRKDLSSLILIAFSINLVFVFVAIIDSIWLERSGGLLLKYYPFRLNSIGLFFIYLLITMYFSEKNWFAKKDKIIAPSLIVLTIILASTRVAYAQNKEKEYNSDQDYFELTAYIKSQTSSESIFAMVEPPDQFFLPHAFSRLTNRESFVVNKFVPGEKQKLAEWYKREALMGKVRANKIPLNYLNEEYGVSHVILQSEAIEAGLQLEFKNDTYYLYKF